MHDIIVAGGGIAGLASAIALARSGRQVVVLERAEVFSEMGAGLQIGPNAVRALEHLGVWRELEASTVSPQSITIRNGVNGQTLSTIPLGFRFSERFGAPYRVASRDDLLQALLKGAAASPNVELRTGCEVANCAAQDSAVQCALANGQTVSGRYLIGADGLRSAVRQYVLRDGEPQFSGHAIYRALLSIGEITAKEALSAITLWLYPGGHVVHYPVAGGRKFNIVAAVESGWCNEKWSVPAASEELLGHFKDAAHELHCTLKLPQSWLKWAGADRAPSLNWGKGRITLIGDAAHPALPYMAQAGAMALEDAVILSQEISASAGPEALRQYERRRQRRTAKLVKRSRRMGTVYHMKGATALIRDCVIRAMPISANYAQLAWLYDWQVS